MSDEIKGDRVIDKEVLWRQLEELEDGTLGPDDTEDLMALLNRSRAARQIYLDYFEDSAGFRHIAKVLDERGKMPFVESPLASRKSLRLSVLAAAAAVVLAGVVAALIAVARPQPASLAAVVSPQTEWSIDGIVGDPSGSEVKVIEGATLRVASGTVRLETETGNLLLIQGPAEVHFPSSATPRVRSGWLWVDAQAPGEKFVIGAGTFQVSDIGTRFGVRVPEDGPIEVHLIEGRVEVGKPGDPAFSQDLDVAGSATAFPKDGPAEEAELAVDPFPELPQLLARSADYRTTILGQSPAGYWPLDDGDPSELANKVHGSPVAAAAEDTRVGEQGVGATHGFDGLPDGNRSIYLGGSLEKSVLTELGGPHGMKRREGAVSFWFRRKPGGLDSDEVLWMAGISSPSHRVPIEAVVETRLDSTGRLLLEVENNGSDVVLTSSRNLADGRWHHVAASWNPSAVEFYVDGQLVARDVKQRDLGDGRLTGRYVRFGKPSLGEEDLHRPFRGWVDEIAAWSRPLSSTEVAWQYRSALHAAGN